MIRNDDRTKDQIAKERSARPLSSYPRSGKAIYTITHSSTNELAKIIEDRINESEKTKKLIKK